MASRHYGFKRLDFVTNFEDPRSVNLILNIAVFVILDIVVKLMMLSRRISNIFLSSISKLFPSDG